MLPHNQVLKPKGIALQGSTIALSTEGRELILASDGSPSADQRYGESQQARAKQKIITSVSQALRPFRVGLW